MAWPDDTDLPVEVYAAFGADPAGDPGDWTWTNLTARRHSTPIPWRRGASDGASETSPGTATVVLDNDDGALTPLYAMSEYYPHVVLGTPIWIPLRRVEDAFGRPVSSGWGTADSGQVWTTVGGTGSNYSVSGGMGRIAHSTLNVLRRVRLNNSLVDVHQTVDASTSALITGAALVTGVIARYVGSGPDYYWARTEFNAGSTTVMLKVTRVRGGAQTDLGSVAAVPGLTYAANTPLRTWVNIVGDRISMKTGPATDPEPVGWQLEVTDPDPLTAPGATGVQSWLIAGNTNAGTVTASFGNYAVRCDLLPGFADSWLPTFIPSSDGQVHSYVRLTASGILRRLSQGNSTIRSAMARYIPTTNPVAYWPLEDGRDSTIAQSGLLGGTPLQVRSGVIDFTEDAPTGSRGSAHPDVDASDALVGTIVGASATEWQVSIWSKGIVTQAARDDFLNAFYIPWEIRTSGGWVVRAAHQYEIDEAVGVALFANPTTSSATEALFLEDNNTPHLNPGITGEWMHLTFSIQQSGADCNVYLNLDEVEVASAVWPNVTIGAPIGIKAISEFGAGQGTSQNMQDIYLSQLSIHNGVSLVPLQQAGMGFPDESASDRVERVCAERDIPVYVWPGESEALGPQPAGGDLDVLRDAEKVGGLLYERGWGLGFRPHSTRYLQEPALTINLATYKRSEELRPDQVLAPIYDDQGVINDWTIGRRDGSSAQAINAAHIASRGRRDDEDELGVATDAALINHATWRVHVDTWEEMRYPGIPVDLAANPDLIDGWLSLNVGDRVQQTNPPAPHSPEAVDQLVSFMSATIAPDKWSGNIVGYPARPWDVAEADGEQPVPADGSTLVADITDTDTSLLLASTVENGPWWVGDAASQPDDYPMSVRVGGEAVTVSEIEASVVDTFGGNSVSGWAPANTGQTWSHPVGSGSDYPESSGTGRILMSVVNTLYSSVLDVGTPYAQYTVDLSLNVSSAPGASITLWVCAGWQGTNDYNFTRLTLSTGGIMSLGLLRRNGGSLTTVTPSITGTANTSGDVWRVTWRSDAGLFFATMQNITSGAQPVSIRGPATDGATGTGIAILARRESGATGGTVTATVDNLTVTSPQLVTISARGVNGITRAWSAGTPIDVAEPAIAPL